MLQTAPKCFRTFFVPWQWNHFIIMTSQNLKPLRKLQLNSSTFFNQFYKKHQAQMACKDGCAQCCHVDLSIFEGEAQIILEWAQNLNQEQKKELVHLLNTPEQDTVFHKKKACVFLRENRCSIYEGRPIICRTQGAVLQYKTKEEKNNTELRADVCPLNFTEKESFPNQKEWLDLDRLNALQSIAENFYQKNEKEKIMLTKNKEGRVELRDLKKTLLSVL
jgi:Fe-S-cluster containining protein